MVKQVKTKTSLKVCARIYIALTRLMSPRAIYTRTDYVTMCGRLS